VTPADLVRTSGLADHEARRLLTAVTGRDAAALTAAATIDPDDAARFTALAARRRSGEPLQYLEGTVDFGPLRLVVDGRALIPRPETEYLWEMAVAAMGPTGPGTVLVDLCTGSGNLALALRHAFPETRVLATDIDAAALSLAKENAAGTGLDVEFLEGDLFAPLPRDLMGRVDLIVANPPYVAAGDLAALPSEVRDHEPAGALFAGPTGLEVLERIADEAYWWLGVGGWLFCEIGEQQGERALALFSGLDREIRPDLTGRDRYVVARKGAPCCV